MGKRIVKAARAAVAVAAWLAAHTSFATETINATGGAGGTASAGAISASGAVAGSSANGGAQSISTGNVRALGMGAAVSPATCYGSVLGGIAVWSSDECIRDQQFRQLRAINDDAAREFLCQVPEQRRAIVAAGLPCNTQPVGSVMPVFQTGAEAAGGYDAYKPYQYAK